MSYTIYKVKMSLTKDAWINFISYLSVAIIAVTLFVLAFVNSIQIPLRIVACVSSLIVFAIATPWLALYFIAHAWVCAANIQYRKLYKCKKITQQIINTANEIDSDYSIFEEEVEGTGIIIERIKIKEVYYENI